jgi:hypothetical protein
LCELGCSAEFARRSGACGRFEQRRTDFNSRFAGHAAREHGYPAGQDSHAPGRNCDSANWIHFAQRNSEYHGSRFEFAHDSDPRQHHAAVHCEPQHHEYPRNFAQRLALRNLAWHGQWSIRLYSEHRFVESKLYSWEPGQQQQLVAGNESHAG